MREAARAAGPLWRDQGQRAAARRARLVQPTPRPPPHVPVGRPGRRRRDRDDRRAARAPAAHARLHRARLRPARHRAQRAAALPGAGARRAAALDPGRRGLRAAARAGARVLHDAGLGRGHGGDPPGRRRQEADAVRHLLRHRAGARVRARIPGPGRADDPRLHRRSRRQRTVRPRRLPRDGPVAARAVPGWLPRRQCRSRRGPCRTDREAPCGAAARRPLRRPRTAPARDAAADRARRPDVRRRLQPGAPRGGADGRARRARPRRRRPAAAAARGVGAVRGSLGATRVLRRPLRDGVRGDAAPLAAWDAAGGPVRRRARARAGAAAHGLPPVRRGGRLRGRDRPLPALAGPGAAAAPARRSVPGRPDAAAAG